MSAWRDSEDTPDCMASVVLCRRQRWKVDRRNEASFRQGLVPVWPLMSRVSTNTRALNPSHVN